MRQEDSTRFAINDDEVLQLARYAVTIEDHYKRPMDIEWAKDGDSGKLFILQARPETVKAAQDARIQDVFQLQSRGKILVTGKSVGQKIATGKHRDPSKWYDGLITDWNMRDRVLVSPDNRDKIPESRRYAVSCDDPGLCKAPFHAAKNVEYPEAREIEALEYYVEHFLWGGLQMTDRESHPFGLYGIQDWKRNRESSDPGTKGRLHLWRIYDYPHVVMLYLYLYRIARDHPQIPTRVGAGEYLRRAHGTAMALFKYPLELVQWSPYETGLYNELVIEEVIEELDRAGQIGKASELREHWQGKGGVQGQGPGRQLECDQRLPTTLVSILLFWIS